MFASFFYLLRQRGLDVSLNEWLTLLQGMEQGLHRSSLTGFYQLCRAVLVKSEAEYDRFDQVFLEFFKDVPWQGELPEEVLAELTRTSHRHYSPGFYFGREQARQAELKQQAAMVKAIVRELLKEQEKSRYPAGSPLDIGCDSNRPPTGGSALRTATTSTAPCTSAPVAAGASATAPTRAASAPL